jgi:hypothetical protein
MQNGPSLVVRGTILGCLGVAVLGWFLAGQIKITANTEVAFAAVPSEAAGSSEAQDTCQVSLSYPMEILQWCRIITEKAIQADLPPDLIAAVMLQESGGDASAYSSSGAVGLMQVMPRDGIASEFECVNGPCFASRPTIDELLEPGFNVEYGSSMLAGLIVRTGSTREALKSYGPMDVGYSYADRVLAIYENYR